MERALGDELLELRASSRRLVRGAPALRALGARRRAAAVADACVALLDARDVVGRALRQELESKCGLSSAMIGWGLELTLGAWDADAVVALLEDAPEEAGEPPALAAVILAGNVFTAALRALALPLVAGVPVLAKASSADDALPRYFEKALRAADADVGAGLKVVSFPRGESAREATLLAHSDVVSVYGDDATVAAVRARGRPEATFVAHGHGLGAGYVARDALADEARAHETALSVALDVAAYDQRGCLSPHAILVEAGAPVAPARFAEILADRALPRLEERLPRGAVPPDALAEQVQWRGVAAARGMLHARERWAVSFEGEHPLRPSPGHRNVGVYACSGPEALAARLAPFAPHLKALGVAGDEASRRRLAALAPYTCAAGAMQTPPFTAKLDRLHPFAGLVKRR